MKIIIFILLFLSFYINIKYNGGIFSSSTNNSSKENIQKNTQIPYDLEEYVISEDILQKNGLRGYYLKFNNKRKLPVIENFQDKTDYIKNNSNVKYISIIPMGETIKKISEHPKSVDFFTKFIKGLKGKKNTIFIVINENLRAGTTNSNFKDYKIIKEQFKDIENKYDYWEAKFIFENGNDSIKANAWKLYEIINKNSSKKSNIKNNSKKIINN